MSANIFAQRGEERSFRAIGPEKSQRLSAARADGRIRGTQLRDARIDLALERSRNVGRVPHQLRCSIRFARERRCTVNDTKEEGRPKPAASAPGSCDFPLSILPPCREVLERGSPLPLWKGA